MKIKRRRRSLSRRLKTYKKCTTKKKNKLMEILRKRARRIRIKRIKRRKRRRRR